MGSPVLNTRRHGAPFSFVRFTSTRPPCRLYLTALVMRLPASSLISRWEAESTQGCVVHEMLTLLLLANSAASEQHSLTTAARSSTSRSKVMSPLSRRLIMMISLMRLLMRIVSLRIRLEIASCLLPPRGISLHSSSAKPLMEVMGVFSSCEADSKKSCRILAALRCAVTSEIMMMAPPSMAPVSSGFTRLMFTSPLRLSGSGISTATWPPFFSTAATPSMSGMLRVACRMFLPWASFFFTPNARHADALMSRMFWSVSSSTKPSFMLSRI